MSEPPAPYNGDEIVASLEDVHREIGGRASGPYVPKAPASADDPDAEASRSRALAGWRKAGAELVNRVRKWNEKSLDKCRLPHPLLGNLTVREILFFTIYHDRHHLESVRKRLGNVAS